MHILYRYILTENRVLDSLEHGGPIYI